MCPGGEPAREAGRGALLELVEEGLPSLYQLDLAAGVAGRLETQQLDTTSAPLQTQLGIGEGLHVCG